MTRLPWLRDFNGDGNLDLVLSEQWHANGPGNGDPLVGHRHWKFQVGGGLSTVTDSQGIVAADFDGHGKLDLAVTNSQSETLTDSAGQRRRNRSPVLRSSPRATIRGRLWLATSTAMGSQT